MGFPVDNQAGKVDYIPAVQLAFLVIVGITPQLGLDPGHYFQWVKGLCHIIVRPKGEAVDFVHPLHLGRQHNHREIIFLPDFLAEGKAV